MRNFRKLTAKNTTKLGNLPWRYDVFERNVKTLNKIKPISGSWFFFEFYVKLGYLCGILDISLGREKISTFWVQCHNVPRINVTIFEKFALTLWVFVALTLRHQALHLIYRAGNWQQRTNEQSIFCISHLNCKFSIFENFEIFGGICCRYFQCC